MNQKAPIQLACVVGRHLSALIKRFLRPDRRSYAGLILAMHLFYLVVLQGVLWVDSASYLRIAFALSKVSPGPLQGDSLWWHNYVPVGLPILWNALALLPVKLIWPALALTQHFVAAASLIFTIRALHEKWPSHWIAAAGLVICALPFYQSMHNAFLTESLSSSMLIVCLGLMARTVGRSCWRWGDTLAFAGCIFVASQIRSMAALYCLLLALLALAQAGRCLSRHSALLMVVTISGILLFPVLRTIQGGEFIEPNLGASRLFASFYTNAHPSEDVNRRLQKYPWPKDLQPAKLLAEGASIEDINRLLGFWVDSGSSNRQAIVRARELGSIVLLDGITPLLNAISYGLSASGLNVQLLLLPPGYQVMRKYEGLALYQHEIAHYQYLSWINPPIPGVKSYLYEFFAKSDLSDAHHLFAAAMTPYLPEQPRPAVVWVTLLGYVPPDLLFVLGIGASLFLLRRIPVIGVSVLIITVANIYIAGTALFPDIRYSYPLLPLFILAAAFAGHARRKDSIPFLGWIRSLLIRNLPGCRADWLSNTR